MLGASPAAGETAALPPNTRPPAPLEVDTENVTGQISEEDVTVVSKASELVYGYTDFGWPSPERPLRLGIVRYATPAPLEGLLDATISQLKNFFGESTLSVRIYSLEQLSEAVHKGEVDIFISSSGRFRRLVLEGARDLATGLSKNYPDPNRSDAVAMVVKASRTDLRTLDDLRGTRLVTSVKEGFTGYDIPMGEIVREGYPIENFFSRELFLGDGNHIAAAFEKLRRNEADVAFTRLCLLEKHLARHPEEKGLYRVVHPMQEEGEVCQRSTELYPAWTVATTSRTDPRLSRLVTRALLQMPPAGDEGFYWGVATDYSRVDQLFEQLHVGPYRYLDEWTLERIWERARGWVFAVLAVLAALIGHSLRVGYLVRLRTAELTRALEEQRRLEIRTREAGERIDRLERIGAVGQLSSIFAHEMRQPLSALSLYVFALQRGMKKLPVPAGDTARLDAIFEKISRETERANSIVERVRLYARADRPPRNTASIRSILSKAVSDLKLSARFKGEIHLVPGEDVELTVDTLGMELVFVNLLKNALEAQRPAGQQARVIVKMHRSEDGSDLLITFDDNGPVLTPESREAILGTPTSTKATGLGLGLSIVRSILEAHSARLTYTFKSEGGVIAEVSIPLLEESQRKEGENS